MYMYMYRGNVHVNRGNVHRGIYVHVHVYVYVHVHVYRGWVPVFIIVCLVVEPISGYD